MLALFDINRLYISEKGRYKTLVAFFDVAPAVETVLTKDFLLDPCQRVVLESSKVTDSTRRVFVFLQKLNTPQKDIWDDFVALCDKRGAFLAFTGLAIFNIGFQRPICFKPWKKPSLLEELKGSKLLDFAV